jgi:hypothetical protein
MLAAAIKLGRPIHAAGLLTQVSLTAVYLLLSASPAAATAVDFLSENWAWYGHGA